MTDRQITYSFIIWLAVVKSGRKVPYILHFVWTAGGWILKKYQSK